MDFGTMANIGFLLLFAIAGGFGIWMWIKRKREEGD